MNCSWKTPFEKYSDENSTGWTKNSALAVRLLM